MRPRAEWMTDNDDSILEFLEDSGLALPPRAIEYNIKTRHSKEMSYSTINRRLKMLNDKNLVEKEYESGGFYSITDKGQDYLSGELDASELEDDS